MPALKSGSLHWLPHSHSRHSLACFANQVSMTTADVTDLVHPLNERMPVSRSQSLDNALYGALKPPPKRPLQSAYLPGLLSTAA